MLLLVQQRSERRASERADERSGQAGNTAASPPLKTIPCGTSSRLDSFDVGGTLNAIGLEKNIPVKSGARSRKNTEQLQSCVPTGAHGKS